MCRKLLEGISRRRAHPLRAAGPEQRLADELVPQDVTVQHPEPWVVRLQQPFHGMRAL